MKSNQIAEGKVETKSYKTEKLSAKRLKDKEPKKRLKKFLAVGISAVILFSSYGLLISRKNKGDKFALAKVSYPSLSSYPKEEDYFNKKTGEFESTYDKKYDEWKKDQAKLVVSNREYEETYKKFIRNNMGAFFSDVKNQRLFSPLNFYIASSMLTELVEGESREELAEFLEESSIEKIRENSKNLWISNYQDDGRYSSILSNSIWLRNGENYNQELLDLLAESYYASIFSGDIKDPNYVKEFRGWINDATRGLLMDQSKNLRMTADTIVKLVSTIYFNDSWQDEFYEGKTKKDIFYGPKGEIEVNFMYQSLENHKYYRGSGFSAIQKPLKEAGDVWFILPNEADRVEDIIEKKDLWDMILEEKNYENKKDYKINLALPKFDLTSNLDLIPYLKTRGVNKIFNSQEADFTPLGEFDNSLFVSEFMQASRVMIDEKAVTAAAYTVIGIKEEKMPEESEEVDFIVNRPFIFIINNREGLPIFIGLVNSPVD